MPPTLDDTLAALDKIQRRPRQNGRTRPGELTLLRALADQVRQALDAPDPGRHVLDSSQVTD